MNGYLDFTFCEKVNTTLDKTVVKNLNIIRKRYLSLLKMVEIFGTALSTVSKEKICD